MYSGTGKRKITLKWVYLLSVWERERDGEREERILQMDERIHSAVCFRI